MLDRSAGDSTPHGHGVDIDRVGKPPGTTDIQVTAPLDSTSQQTYGGGSITEPGTGGEPARIIAATCKSSWR